jgi:uncharacterized membrane protein
MAGAAALFVHFATVYATPWVIMARAIRTVAAEGYNRPQFPPRADETSRTIVRPSPDLLYAACAFDVSGGAVRITAEVPPQTYWSISLFGANTDNFYKRNDLEAEGRRVDLVLVRRGATNAVPAETRRVEAPTDRGIILTRTLVGDEGRLEELDRVRRTFTCGPM